MQSTIGLDSDGSIYVQLGKYKYSYRDNADHNKEMTGVTQGVSHHLAPKGPGGVRESERGGVPAALEGVWRAGTGLER